MLLHYLEGKLTVVDILEKVDEHTSLAELVDDKRRIFVNNAFENVRHIVRFDYSKNFYYLENSFLPLAMAILPLEGLPLEGNDLYNLVNGLPSNKYVLYGIWNPKWSFNRIPHLNKVNEYFDPGKMGKVIYIGKESNSKKGKLEILFDKVNRLNFSFREIFLIPGVLSNPMKYARVFLLEDSEGFYALNSQSKKHEIVPFRMRPLKLL